MITVKRQHSNLPQEHPDPGTNIRTFKYCHFVDIFIQKMIILCNLFLFRRFTVQIEANKNIKGWRLFRIMR